MDIVDRIFELVDSVYDEQRIFAEDIGVTPSIVSEWRRRKSASYSKRLPQIAEALNTTTEYLLTGKKTATPAQHQETTAAKDGGLLEEFGRIFDTLTPENQNVIIAEMLKRLREQ